MKIAEKYEKLYEFVCLSATNQNSHEETKLTSHRNEFNL